MFGRLTFPQKILGMVLGVAGGIYVYKPIFDQFRREQKQIKETLEAPQDVAKED
ncbi:PREDICTED: protein PIGBOS1 [Gavialis gangeticus]|uniref:protein PIGBOS1 n=1 Tax=Gavialis gangeticus TaxID=94835 RepID=UPI00092FB25A|nr:PREDICTED: protein PIGBOS1 [Gavialis gangeticus]